MSTLPTRTPTRRAVVAGALWSAPAVLIATAASANQVSGQAAAPIVTVLAVRAGSPGGAGIP